MGYHHIKWNNSERHISLFFLSYTEYILDISMYKIKLEEEKLLELEAYGKD